MKNSMYTPEQLAALSGGNAYKQTPLGGAYYDTINLGNDGKYYMNFYSQPKDQRQDPEEVTAPFTAIILKPRRKLIQWDNREKVLESIEYDAGATTIPTTQGNMTEKEAKSRGAKVQIVLYMLMQGRIVRTVVTGSSLYNPEDIDDMRLYAYLQSFGDDEHMFMYETIIGSKPSTYTDKDGFDKTTYQMTFKRGTALTSLDEVGTALTQLAESLVENDARDLKYLGSSKPAQDGAASAAPTEAVDPNSVPF